LIALIINVHTLGRMLAALALPGSEAEDDARPDND